MKESGLPPGLEMSGMVKYLASTGKATRNGSTTPERSGKKGGTRKKTAKSTEGTKKTSTASAKTTKKKRADIYGAVELAGQQDITPELPGMTSMPDEKPEAPSVARSEAAILFGTFTETNLLLPVINKALPSQKRTEQAAGIQEKEGIFRRSSPLISGPENPATETQDENSAEDAEAGLAGLKGAETSHNETMEKPAKRGIETNNEGGPKTAAFSETKSEMKDKAVSTDPPQPSTDSAVLPEPPEFTQPLTTQSIGALLRAAREKKGISLATISHLLRLSLQQAEALETGTWDKLPGQTFIRGFARNYAREVDIDPEKLRMLLDRVLALTDKPELEMAPVSSTVLPEYGERQRSNYFLILVGLVIFVGLILAYFFIPGYSWNSSQPSPEEKTVSMVPATGITVLEEQKTIEPELIPLPSTAGDTAIGAGTGSPASDPGQAVPGTPSDAAPGGTGTAAGIAGATGMARLEFSFAGKSWVEIRGKNDQVVFSRTNEAGTAQTVGAELPLTLVVGNADQVSLTFNGKKFEFPPRSRDGVARFRIE